MQMKQWAVVATMLGALACGNAEAPQAPAERSSELKATYLEPSKVPPRPAKIDLAKWKWGTPFYSARSTKSAYTFVMRSAESKEHFVAYGFDVASNTWVFYAEGNILEHQSQFEAQITRDLVAAQGFSGPDLAKVGLMMSPKRPPSPPGPPTDEYVWGLALKLFAEVEAWQY
jgi:hypothetical protein